MKMARQYQSHNTNSTRPNTKSKKKNKKKSKKKKGKSGKDKVFSLGFVVMNLIIATILFFVFLIVGIQIGPHLPI